MARFQNLAIGWVSFLIIIFIFEGSLLFASGCHPNSKELHICLNIYLERDLPLVETIVKGQRKPGRYGGGRVLLEDPDIQAICNHAAGLEDCYKTLVGECDTYWQMDRYQRLMDVLHKTYSYLCLNSTNHVRDLLLNTKCLTMAESLIANCSNDGFGWATTWKEVLRMQVSPSDRCAVLDNYKRCLTVQLQGILCGQEAARVYGSLLDVWLDNWCNRDTSREREYFYLPKNHGHI